MSIVNFNHSKEYSSQLKNSGESSWLFPPLELAIDTRASSRIFFDMITLRSLLRGHVTKTCIKCNNTFSSVNLTGTVVDIRGRVHCWKCKPYNSGNRKTLETRESKVCSRCKKDLPISEFYFKASTGRRTKTPFCSKCLREYNQERELNFKIQLIKLLGGKCLMCGYNKNITALDFHHINSDDKKFTIAHIGRKHALEEVKKCVLLCSNCHRETHNPEKNNLL